MEEENGRLRSLGSRFLDGFPSIQPSARAGIWAALWSSPIRTHHKRRPFTKSPLKSPLGSALRTRMGLVGLKVCSRKSGRHRAIRNTGPTCTDSYSWRKSMSDFVRVASTGDVKPGSGMVAEVNDKTLAVFNVDGTYHVIDRK